MNVPKLLKQAEKLVSYEKVNEAINVYQEILSEDFQNIDVHNRIAELYITRQDFQRASRHLFKVAADNASLNNATEALNTYSKIIRIQPRNTLAREKMLELYSRSGSKNDLLAVIAELASIYEAEGNKQKAMEHLEKLVSLDSSNKSHQMKLALLFHEQGLKDKSVGLFYQMARDYCRERQWNEALDVLDKAKLVAPAEKDISARIAEVYEKQGKIQKAIEVMIAALAQDASRNDWLSYLARLCIKAGRTDEAEQIYEKLIKSDRSYLVETLPFIEVLIATRKITQAIHRIEKLCQDATDPEVRKKCVDCLEEVLKLDPQHLDAYRLLEAFYSSSFQYDQLAITLWSHAEAYIAKCDYLHALDLAKQLTDLEPYNEEYRRKREFIEKLAAGGGRSSKVDGVDSASSQDAGEEDEADVGGPVDPHFDKEVSIVSDEDLESFLTDIELLEKFGQKTAAIRRLEHVLRQYPQETRLHQKLKTLYFEQKMPKKAAQECLEIAKLLQAHDQKEEANKYIREAQRLNPLLSTAGRVSAPAAPAQSVGGASEAKGECAALKGDLAEISLLDIIQILDNAQKSGKLLVHSEGKEGVIFFNTGKIVNATYLEKESEPAMYALLAVKGGSFVYKPSNEAFPVQINNSNTNVILEGLRLLDEANRDAGEAEPTMEEAPEEATSSEAHEVMALQSHPVFESSTVLSSSAVIPLLNEDSPLEEI